MTAENIYGAPILYQPLLIAQLMSYQVIFPLPKRKGKSLISQVRQLRELSHTERINVMKNQPQGWQSDRGDEGGDGSEVGQWIAVPREWQPASQRWWHPSI